ncbi:MAG: MotA/TolQ/ExbB proton channel family protein [Planctomycetota bacterium]|nr:MotA/TolQ/ExbB proton channel family protein [Planctomycetota bacterium]
MQNKLAFVRLTAWTGILLVILALIANGPPSIQAQEPKVDKTGIEDEPDEANEAEEEEAVPESATLESLGNMIFKWPENTSEWFSIFFYLGLAAFSIYAATVAIERLINLKRANILPVEFEQSLKTLISSQQDSKDQFSRLANAGDSPAHLILQSAVKRAGRALPEVEKSMEDAAVREITSLQAKNRPLSVVGSTAPLVGLLGTVVGMIFAFQISSQEGLGKAELLAKGIYLALLTTAGGLTIAIPCLLLVAMLNGRVDRYFREIDICLLQTIPSFTRMEFQVDSGQRESRSVSANAKANTETVEYAASPSELVGAES